MLGVYVPLCTRRLARSGRALRCFLATFTVVMRERTFRPLQDGGLRARVGIWYVQSVSRFLSASLTKLSQCRQNCCVPPRS